MYTVYLVGMVYTKGRSVGVRQLRDDMRALLDAVQHHGDHVTITRNARPAAVLVSPDVWARYAAAERADDGLCAVHNTDSGEPMTRDQLAANLHTLADSLGGLTVQLSAGEASAISGLLDEFAMYLNGEPLGALALEWAARLARRADGER